MASPHGRIVSVSPDRRSTPDSNAKILSTAAEKLPVYLLPRKTPPTSPSQQIDRVLFSSINHNRASASPPEQHRFQYTHSPPHNTITRVHRSRTHASPQDDQCKNILRQLSSKVKGLIKQNVELRGWEHKGQLSSLKDQNNRLQHTIDRFKRSQVGREEILEEENTNLRSYIASNQSARRAKQYQPISHTERSHIVIEQPQIRTRVTQKTYQKTFSQDDIQRLKSYMLTYVNTVIEQNDDRFIKQQRYVDTLQARLAGMERSLEHYKFERQVKMTQTNRRSQIVMSKVKEPVGEQDTIALAQFHVSQDQPDYKQLLELYNSLRVKYEREVSVHVRDKGQWESLTMTVQRLQAQKAQLQISRDTLIEQLTICQKRVDQLQNSNLRVRRETDEVSRLRRENTELVNQLSISRRSASREKTVVVSTDTQVLHRTIAQLKSQNASLIAQLNQPRQVLVKSAAPVGQTIIHTTTTPEVEAELRAIRSILLTCQTARFTQAQKQIRELLFERNRMRRQLTLKSGDQEEVQEQLRQLKERNKKLEEICKNYERQLAVIETNEEANRQSSANSRIIELETIGESASGGEDLQAIHLTKTIQKCLNEATDRLDRLQKNLAASRVRRPF